MRRTLKIYRNAWTRFGNCPDNPLPVLPQSDDGGKNWNCRFSTLQGRAGSVFSCEAGTIAFVKRTRSQPRLRGCSRGLGCYPNKQRNRHPAATPDVCFEHLWEQMPCLPFLYRIRYNLCCTETSIIPRLTEQPLYFNDFLR